MENSARVVKCLREVGAVEISGDKCTMCIADGCGESESIDRKSDTFLAATRAHYNWEATRQHK